MEACSPLPPCEASGLSYPTLSILIPAAGSSERLGQVKQLVEYHGVPLIKNMVNVASSIGPAEIIVVTGAYARVVTDAVPHPAIRWVHNEQWSDGMGASIAKGAATISPTSTGVMILLCDLWRIQDRDLRKLAETWQSAPSQIVCSQVEGVSMPPVIFPASCFTQLRSLKGRQGARGLIHANNEILTAVEIRNAAFDLDTEAQLKDLGSE